MVKILQRWSKSIRGGQISSGGKNPSYVVKFYQEYQERSKFIMVVKIHQRWLKSIRGGQNLSEVVKSHWEYQEKSIRRGQNLSEWSKSIRCLKSIRGGQNLPEVNPIFIHDIIRFENVIAQCTSTNIFKMFCMYLYTWHHTCVAQYLVYMIHHMIYCNWFYVCVIMKLDVCG